ncbi:BQ2448_2107 [Microbotryum intermedium]|uniref:BQ2448_2107 protein n=1 Tax=Microbotryum intermedium TaxID=269621 RepID=A0A238F7G1_9BASI|nr:BQ2448_2107 [Microbotryum intermedium]
MSKRPPRASSSRIKSYNEEQLQLGGRLISGGGDKRERMDVDEQQDPLRGAGGGRFGLVVDDEDDDEYDEDEDEEGFSSVYLKAIQAYENIALKKDQRRADKTLKEARAILTATSNKVDSNIRTEMAKADRMIKQVSEASAKITRESQDNSSSQWAITFSSQHAVAEQVTQELDAVREDLKSRDGELFQEMIEAFTERSSRNKKVFKKFKQAVIAQEFEAIEMARRYEESARAQIRYFKAAAKA